MIVSQFPELTRVAIIDNDDGYLIKREKSDETLDIWFNTANEAIDYAIANHLFIIVTDDGCDGWN